MFGIKEKKSVLKYTLLIGIIAGTLMAIVYAMLVYIGVGTSGFAPFANGGALLTSVTGTLLGNTGKIILAIAVILACFTTSVGLTTAVSEFMSVKFPKMDYKKLVIINAGFSFLVANVGLNMLIKMVLPLLVLLYPVVTVMVILSLFNSYYENRPEIYWFGMLGALSISLFDGLNTAGILTGLSSKIISSVPLGNLGIGWIIPAAIGIIIGFSPIGRAVRRLCEVKE